MCLHFYSISTCVGQFLLQVLLFIKPLLNSGWTVHNAPQGQVLFHFYSISVGVIGVFMFDKVSQHVNMLTEKWQSNIESHWLCISNNGNIASCLMWFNQKYTKISMWSRKHWVTQACGRAVTGWVSHMMVYLRNGSLTVWFTHNVIHSLTHCT